MLSYHGHINIELSDIVKMELTSIQQKPHTVMYFRYLYITTDDGSVYCLKLIAEDKEALKPKYIE